MNTLTGTNSNSTYKDSKTDNKTDQGWIRHLPPGYYGNSQLIAVVCWTLNLRARGNLSCFILVFIIRL